MNKVGIITVQNSMNYGAYLQAYALSSYCKQMGKKSVYFIKTNARHPYIDTLKQIIKAILKGKPQKIKYYLILLKKYRKAWKVFKVIPKEIIDTGDLCITGSDEIWNIARKDFLNFPIFFGEGLNTKQIIAYAPSCNITSLETFKENPNVIESLKKYEKIAVRDYHTQEVISNVLNKNVEIVLDPTLIVDKEKYWELEQKYKINHKYILIYGDDLFTEEQKEEIKRTAKNKNLKLISAGLYIDWCDENIPASPMEFLGLIHSAEYVITTTFHGSVFSCIYEKQFVVYPGKKQKVLDFLKAWELEKRNINNRKNLLQVIEEPIDYVKFGSNINEIRKKSRNYLNDSIK